LLPQVRTAGSVFLGPWAAAAAADYATGANHVLPTGGGARSFSALGLEAFRRVLQVQQLDGEGLAGLEPVVTAVATAEGMVAHAESVRARRKGSAAQPTVTGPVPARLASRTRTTRETEISVRLVLEGRGVAEIDTGLPFVDHMLRALAVHARLDLELRARGDLEVDPHHTVEDVAIVLGEALSEALGDRRGIVRFGDAVVPLDESRSEVAIDLGGRGYAVIELPFAGQAVGSLPTSLVAHFLETFALRGSLTLQARAFGRDDHHLAEATFKALARALHQACARDPSLVGATASTK
jgi:imidazoleglycerol-phosphate dehydratase